MYQRFEQFHTFPGNGNIWSVRLLAEEVQLQGWLQKKLKGVNILDKDIIEDIINIDRVCLPECTGAAVRDLV